MKWFRNWIMSKAESYSLKSEVMADRDYSNKISGRLGPARQSTLGSEGGIRFCVHKATGGMVIETNFYNHRTDRSNQGMYVITDDQDLGREITKIITVESLKL